MRHITAEIGLAATELPEGVFMARRSRLEARFSFYIYIYINSTGDNKRISVLEPGYDVLNDRPVFGDVILARYEALIVQIGPVSTG